MKDQHAGVSGRKSAVEIFTYDSESMVADCGRVAHVDYEVVVFFCPACGEIAQFEVVDRGLSFDVGRAFEVARLTGRKTREVVEI